MTWAIVMHWVNRQARVTIVNRLLMPTNRREVLHYCFSWCDSTHPFILILDRGWRQWPVRGEKGEIIGDETYIGRPSQQEATVSKAFASPEIWSLTNHILIGFGFELTTSDDEGWRFYEPPCISLKKLNFELIFVEIQFSRPKVHHLYPLSMSSQRKMLFHHLSWLIFIYPAVISKYIYIGPKYVIVYVPFHILIWCFEYVHFHDWRT